LTEIKSGTSAGAAYLSRGCAERFGGSATSEICRHTSQTGRDAARKIVGSLHLLDQGKHAGKQARLQQGTGLDRFGHAVCVSLRKDALQGRPYLLQANKGVGVYRLVMGIPGG
jgi:hypothetical protein